MTRPPAAVPVEETCASPAQTKRCFNFGQFVSRPFNFVYVFASCVALVFWPFAANSWPWPERARWGFIALISGVLLAEAIKRSCYLPRPNACQSQTFCWGRRKHSGFPSGHTLPAFLLATLVVQAHPKLWFWFAGALLIGWARWNVRAHFVYQVLLSAVVGVGIGFVAGRFL